MQLSFTSLGLLCVAAAIVWFWHDSLRARDIANAAATAACERIGLQFLDGTAAFSSLRFARTGGHLRLRRTYVFDYTSQSIERRQGFAILSGHEVEYVGFAPEHTARPEPGMRVDTSPTTAAKPEIIEGTSTVVTSSSSANTSSNVLDLNEHRTRRLGVQEPRSEVAPKGDRSN
jgi:hypothetical protein